MAFDFNPYAVAGATRPDSFSGMDDRFRTALGNMVESAPEQIRAQLRVMSGYRSPERQAQLWAGALAKYGSPEAARKWVAPPGRSNHNHGTAADLRYLSPEARSWAHQNASTYGLAFPLSNEPWHVELAGARGPARQGHEHQAPPVATTAPSASAAPAEAPAPAWSMFPQGAPATASSPDNRQNLLTALLAQANEPAPPPLPTPTFSAPQGPTLADYLTSVLRG